MGATIRDMDTSLVPPATPALIRRTDLLEVAHILVLVQGAILVLHTLEAVAFLGFAGPTAIVSLGITAAAAVLTLLCARGLANGSGRARRWTLVAETGVLFVGVVDLGLALLMTGEPIGLVSLAGGIVMPATVILILRRS